MPNLLDLPDNCLEIIATQFSSRYFSFQDLSYVLSTFDNRNYCEYILVGKFCSKEHEYFDNIYINLFDNEVTDEDRMKYRIVGPELILPHQTSYLELQKLSLVPLLRVWSGDPTLTIILALHPYVIRHRGHVRKVWGRQQLLLEDYQYFKQREIENITELSIEIDDVVKKGFEGFRYLHPVVLTVTIKSDRWAYPGEIIPQLLDLANVEVFKLAYNKTHAVVTGWDVIVPELEEVKDWISPLDQLAALMTSSITG
ncbi:hypothetical protein Cantr_06916 [Candida viswanathii]|uniref:F-box domain-containing protein n=1 Tax=Candida viswanathii TaxID=5486 RepID=A0A367XZ13_9ASCO|nr:hypothetical protein Cantr_06916 [Candida viswanathii]